MPTIPTIAAIPQRRVIAIARSTSIAAAPMQARSPSAAVAVVTFAPGSGIDDSIENLVATSVISGSYAVMYAGPQSVAPADPAAPGYVFAGIATQSAAQGQSVAVRTRGAFAFSAWSWTPGGSVFVLPGGILTQTAPDSGVLHEIGTALDAVTLLIEPGEPVFL